MCGRFTLRNLDDLKSRYGDTDFNSSYNIGPGQKLLALTDKLQSIDWGFSPYWADKPFNLVNARIETLTEKPSFSNSNRCLIPTDGWYEWRKSGENKIPYFHHLNGDVFFFGGVFGGYRGKVGCAIVTTEAVVSLKPIHERMPLIISKQHFQNWLNGDDINCEDTFSAKSIVHHTVSKHVNNPQHNDPKCVFPTKEIEDPDESLFE
ncbi:SOS response-associated peptidase [Gammaproteobacteria bacterium]|nr:SOS response-associated peptidase [Gammaproteobacteria bacterium]MDC0508989.1 SOS response-associated peptidase [Gammaproteobacteria bacterium]MDC1251789.1 SOS response-associated peptidase [Gammaproteobacteria bacterium]MDC3323510.1 SOS response-associated peptidase [Gammaproteobacteria bacterium]